MSKNSITLVAQPQAFFRELLVQALKHQKVPTSPDTEFYLVNLLNEFISTDRLYARDQDGAALQQPLALMLKQALEVPQPSARGAMFRHIGDVSLYTAGFFPESLSRKLVNLQYYVEVGGAAYTKVALLAAQENQRRIFEELGHKFGRFVEVLAEISDQTTQRTERDLLRIYEDWKMTHNPRAEKALKRAGMIGPLAKGTSPADPAEISTKRVIKKGLR